MALSTANAATACRASVVFGQQLPAEVDDDAKVDGAHPDGRVREVDDGMAGAVQAGDVHRHHSAAAHSTHSSMHSESRRASLISRVGYTVEPHL
jgi:hypothetical protein